MYQLPSKHLIMFIYFLTLRLGIIDELYEEYVYTTTLCYHSQHKYRHDTVRHPEEASTRCRVCRFP